MSVRLPPWCFFVPQVTPNPLTLGNMLIFLVKHEMAANRIESAAQLAAKAVEVPSMVGAKASQPCDAPLLLSYLPFLPLCLPPFSGPNSAPPPIPSSLLHHRPAVLCGVCNIGQPTRLEGYDLLQVLRRKLSPYAAAQLEAVLQGKEAGQVPPSPASTDSPMASTPQQQQQPSPAPSPLTNDKPPSELHTAQWWPEFTWEKRGRDSLGAASARPPWSSAAKALPQSPQPRGDVEGIALAPFTSNVSPFAAPRHSSAAGNVSLLSIDSSPPTGNAKPPLRSAVGTEEMKGFSGGGGGGGPKRSKFRPRARRSLPSHQSSAGDGFDALSGGRMADRRGGSSVAGRRRRRSDVLDVSRGGEEEEEWSEDEGI